MMEKNNDLYLPKRKQQKSDLKYLLKIQTLEGEFLGYVGKQHSGATLTFIKEPYNDAKLPY